MIEVTFGDSAGGGLKYARSYSKELGDIVCLGIMADIGDITEPMFGEYRYRLLCRMLYQEQWGKDAEMKAELKTLGKHYAKEYLRLKRGLKDGEPVRVWISDSPFSMCGFFWLSGLLAKYNAEVCVVEMSRFNERTAAESDRTLTVRCDWGECEPSEFASALPLARRIPRTELISNLIEWQRLVNDNAPLRTVIAGRVVSVPASFYDFLIWRYLGRKPIREAVLIGKILGENQLGVGDWWYAQRIEHFIRRKSIVVLQDSERKYERVIAIAKKP